MQVSPSEFLSETPQLYFGWFSNIVLGVYIIFINGGYHSLLLELRSLHSQEVILISVLVFLAVSCWYCAYNVVTVMGTAIEQLLRTFSVPDFENIYLNNI